MAENHSKISYTAILCAKALAINSNIKYAKEVWETLKKLNYDTHETFSLRSAFFLSRFFKGLQLLQCFLEARYLSIDETLKKLKYPAVVEVASGLTPRGFSYPELYIESDLKEMVKIKKDIISNIKTNKNHKLIQLNILNKNQLNKAGKIYNKFKTNKPLAIIHSGLWTYLTKEEQIKMAENIKKFLKKYSKKGYWLSSDFRPISMQKNNFFRLFRRGITKKTGRPSTRFNNEAEIIQFMDNAGFKTKIISNEKIIPKLNCKIKFNLSSEDIKRQTSGLKVYVMQLK